MKLFEERLADLSPSLTAKEMAVEIVIAALESEFGRNFTINRGFARMVNVLADAIVTHPELRRQTLAVASLYIKQNSCVDSQKNIIRQGDQKGLIAGRAG